MPRRTHLLVLALLTAGCIKDLGSANSSTGDTTGDLTTGSPTTETSTTDAPTCGDGQLGPGEQCDDGNTISGDGCESDCTTTPGEDCGNGMPDPGEDCDDGNQIDIDACKNNCTLPMVSPTCGDNVIDDGEDCDDGNKDSDDACTELCKTAACGDGFVQTGVEDCDDGNTDDTDTCLTTCLPATCGDGHLQAGVEECDNGDDNDDSAYDGCTINCVLGPRCGDEVLNGPEQCDDGTPGGDDLCNACEDTPRRYVFVTSVTYSGKFGGPNNADGLCTGMAGLNGVGVPNTGWVAWLSDDFENAASRMDKDYTGWYATPGDPPALVAKGWEGLTSGALLNPINKTELGTSLAPGESAWTNTQINGAVLTIDQDCNNWNSNAGGGNGRLGDPSAVDSQWTDKQAPNTATCDTTHHIYCVEN